MVVLIPKPKKLDVTIVMVIKKDKIPNSFGPRVRARIMVMMALIRLTIIFPIKMREIFLTVFDL